MSGANVEAPLSTVWKSRLVAGAKERRQDVSNETFSNLETTVPLARQLLEDVSMRTKEKQIDALPRQRKVPIYPDAHNPRREIGAPAERQCGALSAASGPVVVAAVFCLVFLVMGAAFSFSTFASEVGRELK